MTICDKIIETSPNEVHLFKEGVFWVAYEQSAYYFHLRKGYKPTKKFIKKINCEIVSVGFPQSVLPSAELEILQRSDTHIVLRTENAIDETEFLDWKSKIKLTERQAIKQNDDVSFTEKAAKLDIVERIKTFDLSNATPIE